MSLQKNNQIRSYIDQVFAPLDDDHRVDRFAGGNESEVYLTDDRRYVIKIKSDMASDDLLTPLNWARFMREVAEQSIDTLGPTHSIPSYYALSRDNNGKVQILLIQPFLKDARQLFEVDYDALSKEERKQVASELRDIIRRSVGEYIQKGTMPDLYGRSSTSSAERKQLNTPYMLPWRIWSFLIQRNLLRSHNLLLTDAPEHHVVLIDYDPVRQSKLYQRIYYTIRLILFIRDLLLISWMECTGSAEVRE